MKRYDEGSPDEFFADWTLRLLLDKIRSSRERTYDYKVSIANPATQSLIHTLQLYPVLQGTIYDPVLEDGPREEDKYQEHGPPCVE